MSWCSTFRWSTERAWPVKGLTAADFSVLDNRAAQPIVSFAEVDVPAWSPTTATWMRSVPSDVASNRLDALRAVVMVLDDCDTRWDPGVTKIARSTADAVIDNLGPSDLAAVVYVRRRNQGQEFTADRRLLRAAVGRLMPRPGEPPANRLSAATPGGGLVTPQFGRLDSGECMGNPVEALSATLRTYSGRGPTFARPLC